MGYNYQKWVIQHHKWNDSMSRLGLREFNNQQNEVISSSKQCGWYWFDFTFSYQQNFGISVI
jgi:hypothetical protein